MVLYFKQVYSFPYKALNTLWGLCNNTLHHMDRWATLKQSCITRCVTSNLTFRGTLEYISPPPLKIYC